MNGIKLGEDMTEGCVILNGVRKVIQEIKTKAGVVWPKNQPLPYTYTLSNPVINYSQGNKLNPNGNNFAWVTAEYKTWQGSTLISTQTVTCSPSYTVSGQPVVNEGNFIYWDKATYGAQHKLQTTLNVYASYNGLTTTSYASVTFGENTYTITSSSGQKSFQITGLEDIPTRGGSFSYIATSYENRYGTWTSGEVYQETTPILSTLSTTAPNVTLSQTNVNGSVSGTVSFPANTDDEEKTIEFTLHDYSGHADESFTYTQVYDYLTISPTEWNPTAAAGQSENIRVNTSLSSYTIVEFVPPSGTDFVSYSQSPDGSLVQVIAAPNTTGKVRQMSLIFRADGVQDQMFTVRQSA